MLHDNAIVNNPCANLRFDEFQFPMYVSPMADNERLTQKQVAEGIRAAQKLANLLLNANSSNLEADLATADNETTAAILGVSVDKLKQIALPAMELSAALAASSNTPDLSQATLSHATKAPRKTSRASKPQQPPKKATSITTDDATETNAFPR